MLHGLVRLGVVYHGHGPPSSASITVLSGAITAASLTFPYHAVAILPLDSVAGSPDAAAAAGGTYQPAEAPLRPEAQRPGDERHHLPGTKPLPLLLLLVGAASAPHVVVYRRCSSC